LLAGELEQTTHTPIARARTYELDDEPHGRTRGLALEVGRDVTHGCVADLCP
jgi:hypothetical protein